MDVFSALKTELNRRCPTLELRTEEPMRFHTTFRIGGPAALMALPRSGEEAQTIFETAAQFGVEPFFMGNGSNLLVDDSGVRAFVVKSFDGLGNVRREGETSILAGSGVLLSRLAVFAMEHALTGLEFAHGIPGTLGGAITMNAGAYGGEMAQVVHETSYLDRDGKQGTVIGSGHGFSYRHSAFSDGSRFILEAKLTLQPGESAAIRAKMAELAEQRRSKQPLEYPSAGSTFKRPEGHFAAALIDQCGLKGLTVGGAQVSEKHAGFLINRGGATCGDMLTLVDKVRETVFRQTGVELELEVKLLLQKR
jgi:UDP-N-acetylmuramate dehydrogenase